MVEVIPKVATSTSLSAATTPAPTRRPPPTSSAKGKTPSVTGLIGRGTRQGPSPELLVCENTGYDKGRRHVSLVCPSTMAQGSPKQRCPAATAARTGQTVCLAAHSFVVACHANRAFAVAGQPSDDCPFLGRCHFYQQSSRDRNARSRTLVFFLSSSSSIP